MKIYKVASYVQKKHMFQAYSAFSMQGACGFTIPHGPWIMHDLIVAKSLGWVTGSGHWAEISWSMSSGVINLSDCWRNIRQCIWGKPRF